VEWAFQPVQNQIGGQLDSHSSRIADGLDRPGYLRPALLVAISPHEKLEHRREF